MATPSVSIATIAAPMPGAGPRPRVPGSPPALSSRVSAPGRLPGGLLRAAAVTHAGLGFVGGAAAAGPVGATVTGGRDGGDRC